ncbi:MAG: cupin domain-containing protein [Deltaproteobacteria bacterium]|nr:cupin domain-containing protein [Deltaproteobacteria bacterium]RLB66128.1 MAG: cupin [Deltaproteobacteria bacterium]
MTIQSFDYHDKISYNDEKANKIILTECTHARTTLWCLNPGQHIHPHVHAGDHVWIVLEGEGLFLSDGLEPLPINPGTILSAPTGISHGVENTGNAGLVFASISAG